MKFLNKLLISTNTLLVAALPTITLSSCNKNENNVKISVSGVDGIILEKTETEKNKSLNIEVKTPLGNYDILEVSTIKVDNIALTKQQYSFEMDSNASYHLSIDAKYVTGNIEIQLTSTPAVLFKTESSEVYRQYILFSSVRMPKATEKTYSIKLSQKGIQDNKQIELNRVHYIDESGTDRPLLVNTDYTSTWNTTSSCLDVVVKKEKVQWNITFDVKTINAQSVIKLNHYIPDSAQSPISRSGLTVGDQPIPMDDEKEYSFEINTSDWGGEKYQELGSSWFFGFITASYHWFHWIKDTETKIEINDIQLVKDVDFKFIEQEDPETKEKYYVGITGYGIYTKINWESKIKITTVLDGGDSPQFGTNIYPTFSIFKPEPAGDPKAMSTYNEELKGLVCSPKEQVIKPNQTYSFSIDMAKWWPSTPRPADGIIWNFALLDTTTKQPLNIISVDRLNVAIDEVEELGPTEFELKNKSVVHGLDSYEKVLYTSLIKINVGIILPENDSEITCIPAFFYKSN